MTNMKKRNMIMESVTFVIHLWKKRILNRISGSEESLLL